MAPKARAILQLAVLLGTIVVLALAAKNTLSLLAIFGDPKASTFAVQAQRTSAAPGASDFKVRITPIVDGRSLTSESVQRSGDWQPGSVRAVVYSGTKDGVGHGLLRFQGKTVVVVVDANPGSGLVRLARDGREAQVVDFSTGDGQQRPIALESPSAPPSWAVFVGALVLFAGCAWWFGPIRSQRSGTPWLTFFLSVIHLLFWASQCVGTTNDSPVYVRSFALLVAGQPAYFPPGYPVFLGILDAISKESLGRWVVLIQHGMVVGAALWTYLLLRKICTEEIALLGGILAGALPPVVTLAQTVMSETPTLFATVGAFYFAVRSAETGRWWHAILAGSLAGWAGALRLVPLVGLLPSMGVVQVLAPQKHRFRLAGITVAVTTVIMVLPVAWIGYKSGQLQLTDSTGFHLFNRVVNEQKQLDEEGPATRILLGLLEGRDPRGVNVWETFDRVERRGALTEGQIEALFRAVSLEGIRKDPWGFVLFIPGLAWRMLLDDTHGYWTTGWGETPSRHPTLEIPPPLGLTASGLRWRWNLEATHSLVWFMICWAAVGGFFLGLLSRQRVLILALAWVPVGCLLSTAAVEFLCPRYNVPVIPFVAALSMVPLALIIDCFGPAQPNRGETTA